MSGTSRHRRAIQSLPGRTLVRCSPHTNPARSQTEAHPSPGARAATKQTLKPTELQPRTATVTNAEPAFFCTTAEVRDPHTKPLLLDLFCGAGGAAMGYHRAGFAVVGVDLEPQPHYPFPFHQADALTYPLDGFDAIHASPPCQAFTQMSARWRGNGGQADAHLDLLTPTLARLRRLSVPWVVENVIGAHAHMKTTVILHGGMFGLGVHRPRRFESNILIGSFKAPRCDHPIGVYGTKPDGRTRRYRNNGNYKGKSLIRAAKSINEARRAMGIDWMTWNEIREAIPPAYTEHIGHYLLIELAQ